MKYKIIYTADYNTTQKSVTINARDYTAAYVEFACKTPAHVIILEIIEEV